MKASVPILLTLMTITLADIGEKLRLGQSIKATPQKDFNSGLQAPLSTNPNTVRETRLTDHSDDEDNLERLCNDPFHSFLCKPVGPRKIRIDGQLRPGAQLPPNVLTGASSNQQSIRTGGALLASAIQPSTSSNHRNEYLPPVNNLQSLATQQYAQSKANPLRPSNEYLPSNSEKIQKPTDNIQYPLPLEQPQQNVYRYSVIPARPNKFTSQSNNKLLTQLPISTTSQPIRQSPQTILSTVNLPAPNLLTTAVKPIASPSNQYLPVVDPIDIRINPSSTNLSPLVQGGSLLAQARQASSTENQPNKHERQHTLEELCNDAFHSFLCTPITKPRKRIDGRIRPGAKIPPHVLLSAGSIGQGRSELAPQKQGAALLSQGREEEKVQAYYYERPLNKPFFDSQASNHQPVEANLLSDNLPPIPKRISPPNTRVSNQNALSKSNQLAVTQKPITTTQRTIKNFQFQNNYQTTVKKYQTTKRPFINNYQFATPTTTLRPNLIFQTNQLNNNNNNARIQSSPQTNYFSRPQNSPSFVPQVTTPQSIQKSILPNNLPPIPKRIPPAATNNQFVPTFFTTQKPFDVKFQNNFQTQSPLSPLSPTSVRSQPIAAQAQISAQFQPFNNVNRFDTKSESGYQYPKPSTAFTYTTTTRKPITTSNLLYIASSHNNPTKNLKLSENQIITTTIRPRTTLKSPTSTRDYDYQKPSVAFTLSTTKYVAPTVTQSAIPSNNQPVAVTTSKPIGYTYPKPARPFTLPTSTVKTKIEGYTYSRPARPFTLPPRNNVYNVGAIDVRTFPEQKLNFPINNVISGDTTNEDALPSTSQFEIIKP